jgi:ribonuclease P/MRP protein subunit POP8
MWVHHPDSVSFNVALRPFVKGFLHMTGFTCQSIIKLRTNHLHQAMSIPSSMGVDAESSHIVSSNPVHKRKTSPSTSAIGHEITARTIQTQPFSYLHLTLIADPSPKGPIDIITFRTHLTSALTQFLGLTGSAIPIDILKVDGRDIWIRMAKDDLNALISAVGGWVGGGDEFGVGWRVKGSGNWLGAISHEQEVSKMWDP